MRPFILLYLLLMFWQFNNHDSLPAPQAIQDTANTDFCTLSRPGAKAASQLSKTSTYDSAVADITRAQLKHHKECVVSFGKDSAGNLFVSSAVVGNVNSGYIPAIKNRFADVHIHTNEQPPSSGDLYGFIDQITADTNYIRYIITPLGQAYALILINKEEAFRFNTTYARRVGIKTSQVNGNTISYQPTFPQQLVDELNELKAWHEASPEAALVFLLKKYKMGIALL